LPHKPSAEVRERIFRCTHGNLQSFNDFMLRLKTTFDAGINYIEILLELHFTFSIFPICRLKQPLRGEIFVAFFAIFRLTALKYLS